MQVVLCQLYAFRKARGAGRTENQGDIVSHINDGGATELADDVWQALRSGTVEFRKRND